MYLIIMVDGKVLMPRMSELKALIGNNTNPDVIENIVLTYANHFVKTKGYSPTDIKEIKKV